VEARSPIHRRGTETRTARTSKRQKVQPSKWDDGVMREEGDCNRRLMADRSWLTASPQGAGIRGRGRPARRGLAPSTETARAARDGRPAPMAETQELKTLRLLAVYRQSSRTDSRRPHPSPRRGECSWCQPSGPRVSLRFTRGDIPPPLRGDLNPDVPTRTPGSPRSVVPGGRSCTPDTCHPSSARRRSRTESTAGGRMRRA